MSARVLVVRDKARPSDLQIFDSVAAMMAKLCGVSWQDFRGDGELYEGTSLHQSLIPSVNTGPYEATWHDVRTLDDKLTDLVESES